MSGKSRKRTIGLLVSGIMDDYTAAICKGVNRAARKQNVNVIVFPGKYVDRDLSDNRELCYEYQYNTVFSYARNKGLDALIVAADCIGCFTSRKRIVQLLEEYLGIPCIVLASRIEGYPGVIFDNYQGIKDGLEYMIKENGCRKLAMIGGNEQNMDASERKQAFLSVLEENGITFEEHMYVEGDLTRRCGKAFQKVLDDNPGVQGIFCVNDDTAIGLYDEIKRRGLHIGQDIFVLGFDDTVAAAQASPPLASVRADSGLLGEEAVYMACHQLDGNTPESKVLPTRFIMRRSVSGSKKNAENQDFYPVRDFDANFMEIFHCNITEGITKQLAQTRLAYKKLIITFTRNALDGFKNPNCNAEIAACADKFLSTGGMKYADVDIMLSHLEISYKIVRAKQSKTEERNELRDLYFELYRKTVRALNELLGDIQKEKMRESYDMKLFVQDILQFEKGKDQSYGVLLENLNWLSIENADVYLLEKPVLHLFLENFKEPEVLYHKATLRKGVVCTIPVVQQQEAFSTIFDKHEETYCYRVVLPLYSNEVVYGILVCDMTDALHDNGEFLVNQMSAAVKMLKLLEANEYIQQQLEENLATLRDSNIKLDTLSKSDVLTGIYNRRGFYDVAEKLLEECRCKEKNVLAVYVDMNNLKIINDRYGHEEGDHSLKLIGSILHEIAGEQGVAGRIGGDEYAFAIPYTDTGNGNEILEDLYGRFEAYNAASDKKYTVTVSAGAYVIGWREAVTLKDALLQADEKLYLVKQKRKKDVVKHGDGKG